MNSLRTLPIILLLLLLGAASCPAQKGNVLRFNSPTAKVTVPNRDDLNFSGDFTIEMWVWVTSHTPQFSNILEKQDNEYSLYITSDGKINGAIGTNTQFVDVTSTDTLQIGIWYHLAMVYNSKNGLLRLFKDGKPLGATTVSPIEPVLPTTKDLIIGGATASAAVFNGYIDDVRLSRSVRYTVDFDPKPPLPADTNTIALYHFDEGSGNTAADASKKGHEATLTGVSWASIPLAVAPPAEPERIALEANYPNPFTTSTLLDLSLPSTDAAGATLLIFDALGRKIADYTASLHPGANRIAVNGSSFPASGVYLCVLQTTGGALTRRLVRL